MGQFIRQDSHLAWYFPCWSAATEQGVHKMVHILVDSYADRGLLNAQMTNAREIIRRLDPAQFYVSTFYVDEPDPHIAGRPNTRLIGLPRKRQTIRIFREFVLGKHEILFYVKSSPSSKWYLRLRRNWKDNRITVGTVESQCDLRNEPTIAGEAVSLWEQTVLRCDYLFSNSRAVQQSLQSEYGPSPAQCEAARFICRVAPPVQAAATISGRCPAFSGGRFRDCRRRCHGESFERSDTR